MVRLSKGNGGGRGAHTKPLNGPGTLPLQSAMIGGISNRPSPPSFKKSGKTDSFCGGGVAGGFKNKGMANRR
jgi:hypothetical protein